MGLMIKFKLLGTDILKALLPVDGAGSKLDSDMVDGKHYDDIIDDAEDIINNAVNNTLLPIRQQCNATPQDVIANKKFYADAEIKTGTMPLYTANLGLIAEDLSISTSDNLVMESRTFTDSDQNFAIGSGGRILLSKHQNDVAPVIGLTADKIVKGNTILGVAGTAETGVDTSDTTATASDVVMDKTFYGADGTKKTGEVYVMDRLAGRITNYGGTITGGSVTDSNGTIGFYSDPYGFPLYLKDTGGFSVEAPYSVVAQAIGLTGDKIVSGNTILGVNGTATTGVPNTIEVGHNQYSDNGNGAITLTSDSAMPFLFVAKAILPNNIGSTESPGFVTAVLRASWDSMESGSFVELQSGTDDTIKFSFNSQTKKLQVVDKGYNVPCLIGEYAVIYHSL